MTRARESPLTNWGVERAGSRPAIIFPFHNAGTYVPLRRHRLDKRVRSERAEIRRDIYMYESTRELHAGLQDVMARLARFVATCAPAA
jgi:hypothetical protein